MSSVMASTFSWIGDGDVGVNARVTSETNGYERMHCRSGGYIDTVESTTPYSVNCSYDTEYSKLAFRRYHNNFVSVGGDDKYYRVENISVGFEHSTTRLVPGTEKVIVREYADAVSTHFVYYSDFTRRLNMNNETQVYRWDRSDPDFVLKDELANNVRINEVGTSENGRWIAVEVYGVGLALFDSQELDTKLISKYRPTYGQGRDPTIEMRVSNDGKYVAVAGQNVVPHIIEVNEGCGDSVTSQNLAASTMIRDCRERDLHTPIMNAVDNLSLQFVYPEFDNEGGQLTMRVRNSVTYEMYQITVTAPGYTSASQLDYLALGDSYSSGEGDTETNPAGEKYYRQGTDIKGDSANIPEEKCHLSTRSYPYLLASGMSLGQASASGNRWQSVACGGATAWDVKERAYNKYLGQGDRLKGYDDAESLKAIALNEYIPGRQKQIEFVKKYKPRVITLTIGGNDVGFGDKLKNCVRDPGICDIVDDKRDDIASEIRKQYKTLKDLYQELYLASGSQTKIYVLGYPNFINSDEHASCELNVGFLNQDERELIVNSVAYLNNVIEHAVNAAGFKYVDIENSLDGHKLCDDGEKYVTGITDPLDWNGNSSESFHPNARGHQQMALAVWDNVWNEQSGMGESLIDYDVCPDSDENSCPDDSATVDTIQVPEYFASVDSSKNIETKRMASSNQRKGSSMEIFMDKFTFAPGSMVQMTLHSDPIDLGEYNVDAQGSMHTSVSVPVEVPAGYHTIIATGTSYSGEQIEYQQVILVNGVNSSDVDEDGVPDEEDQCLFIAPAGRDDDQDGIDDRCDLVIGEQPIVSPSPTPSATPDPSPTPSPSPAPDPGTTNPVTIILDVIIKTIRNIVNLLIKIFSFGL